MHPVGVVGGEHHAAGEGGLQGLVVAVQRRNDPAHQLRKERGIRALAGAAAHLLVVKHTGHVHMVGGFRLQQRPDGGIGALQVVQPRRGDVFPRRAPESRFVPVDEIEVAAQYIRVIHTQRLGHQCPVIRSRCADHRQHVHLGIQLDAVVHGAVEVDRQVWYQRHFPVETDQPRSDALFRPDHRATGDGQGPVEPGLHDHAAILLHVQ